MNKTNFGGRIGRGRKNVLKKVNLGGNMGSDKRTESSQNKIFRWEKKKSNVKNVFVAGRSAKPTNSGSYSS